MIKKVDLNIKKSGKNSKLKAIKKMNIQEKIPKNKNVTEKDKILTLRIP